MLEIDKLRKKQKEGLIVTIIGIVFFMIGLFAYSITESHTNDVIGVPIKLVSRPYGIIGAFLMLLGIVEIVVGIISKLHYDNKLRIYDIQFSKQNPQGQYQQPYPQLQYQQPYPQPQYYNCPNCNLQVKNGTQFCPGCGTNISKTN